MPAPVLAALLAGWLQVDVGQLDLAVACLSLLGGDWPALHFGAHVAYRTGTGGGEVEEGTVLRVRRSQTSRQMGV